MVAKEAQKACQETLSIYPMYTGICYTHLLLKYAPTDLSDVFLFLRGHISIY